ncbi:MAG TPA: FAD-dependent oxidoreductase [Chloroflexota bacterium]|nr:FAD-dependent oxidoreductase [Chloroflexota bacterium]
MKHRSLWLQEVLGNETSLPPLRGAARTDIAIIGGGYVGLWTAIRIKQREPDCDVTILEQDICGGGASGRNGGFALSWWPKISSLVKLCGEGEAVRLGRASGEAIGEIRDFCDEYGIDAHFVQGGLLWTATTPAQIGAWETVVTLCERLGVDAFRRLSPAEVARRAGSPTHLAGVLEPSGATVQPAALARGLRKVALELGVRIYEGTRVRHFSRDYPVAIRTDDAVLAAEKLVIAMNAWAAGIRELSQALIVVSSDIVATAPIPERLQAIGWTGGECITDSQMMVDYYRTTRDGRIVFGKGGWGLALGDRIGESFDRDPGRAETVIADLHRTFPALSDVVIDGDWAGPIDRSNGGLPLFGHLGSREHIVYGVGWSGNGVGPSVLGGKILSALALGVKDEWSESGLVDRRFARFPPEPIRFIGAHLIREGVIRKERAEAQGATPHPAWVQAARLVPAGLEDKG